MLNALKIIFVDKVAFVLHSQFILFIILLALNFKVIKSALRVRLRALMLMLCIISAALSPLVYLNALGERQMADQVEVAHRFLTLKDFSYSYKFFYGPFYPYLLDFLCLFLTCVIVFLFSYFLFQRDIKSSLLALAFFIFLNYFAISSPYMPFDRSLAYGVQLFFALSVFLIFLSFKIDKKAMYALALQSILLISEIKFEFLALLASFVLGLFLFRKIEIHRTGIFQTIKNKLLIPFSLFLLFFPIPFYGYLYLVSGGYELNASILLPFLSFGDHVDIANASVGIYAFAYFWTQPVIVVFSALIVAAFFLSLWNKKRFKNWLLLFFTFALLSFFYLSSRNGYDARYASFLFPIVAIMSSSFLFELQRLLDRINVGLLSYVAPCIALLFVFYMVSLVPLIFPGIVEKSKRPMFFRDELDMARHIRCDENTLLIVPDTITEIKLSALTLCETTSLERLIYVSNEHKTLFEEYSKKYDQHDIRSPARRIYDENFYVEIKDLREKILEEATDLILSKKSFQIPFKKKNLFLDINTFHVLHKCSEQCYKKMARLVKDNFKLRLLYANENMVLYKIE